VCREIEQIAEVVGRAGDDRTVPYAESSPMKSGVWIRVVRAKYPATFAAVGRTSIASKLSLSLSSLSGHSAAARLAAQGLLLEPRWLRSMV